MGAKPWIGAACALALAAPATAGAQAPPPPGAPVVATAPAGAFAVAVPALADRPALAGSSVAFVVEDHARGRLLSIGAAGPGGPARTLYLPPRRRAGTGSGLVASPARVALIREHPGDLETCGIGGECSPSSDEVIAGPAAGPLARSFGATERLAPRGSCRRRIAQLGGHGVSVSDDRVAYARRVRCLEPRRRGRPQVVVRDLRSGRVRVVHRGPADDVQLAGRYVAFARAGRRDDGTVVVKDLDARRVAYRARVEYPDYYSLGADGVIARTLLKRDCCPAGGRLGWHSPASPRLHRLPLRVSIFSGPPIAYAGGRIVYVSRFDLFPGTATLSIADLAGNAREVASFTAPEELESFAFDGERLAFAHTAWRADQGSADDGLRSICVRDDILVQARASVIEVHPVTAPGRLDATALPLAAPYRSPRAERPECPYRD